MIVNDVVPLRESMHSAQRSMNYGLQMLRPDRWQPYQTHPVVFRECWSEVITTVDGDFMSLLRQMPAHLFIVGFDAAVLRDHAPSPDEGDTERAPLLGCERILDSRGNL